MIFFPSSPGVYSGLAAFALILPVAVEVLPYTSTFPFPLSSVMFFFAVTVSTSGPLLPIRILPSAVLAITLSFFEVTLFQMSTLPFVTSRVTSPPAVRSFPTVMLPSFVPMVMAPSTVTSTPKETLPLLATSTVRFRFVVVLSVTSISPLYTSRVRSRPEASSPFWAITMFWVSSVSQARSLISPVSVEVLP